jgi:hypothetical protein
MTNKRWALALLALCMTSGCAGSPAPRHETTPADYAHIACGEWSPFSLSRHTGAPKTELLGLAQTDARLAAKDASYNYHRRSLDVAYRAVYPGGPASTEPARPMPEQLAVAVDRACAALPDGR